MSPTFETVAATGWPLGTMQECHSCRRELPINRFKVSGYLVGGTYSLHEQTCMECKRNCLDKGYPGVDIDAIYDHPKYAHLRRVR